MATQTNAAKVVQEQVKREGLITHLVNIYRLAVKELRSIRADPMMLILVAYTFSVAVYTVATGASTEAKDPGFSRDFSQRSLSSALGMNF